MLLFEIDYEEGMPLSASTSGVTTVCLQQHPVLDLTLKRTCCYDRPRRYKPRTHVCLFVRYSLPRATAVVLSTAKWTESGRLPAWRHGDVPDVTPSRPPSTPGSQTSWIGSTASWANTPIKLRSKAACWYLYLLLNSVHSIKASKDIHRVLSCPYP